MAVSMTNARETIWTKWLRYRKLPALERKTVFRAVLILPLTEVGLRLMGFPRWKQFIELFFRPGTRRIELQPEAQLQMAERIAGAVRSAERHGLGKPNCLERSLTLWWLLQRGGIEAELHIGARKNEARFEAHAWVEVKGVVLNDSPDVHKHYARFDAPIAADWEGSS
jgi:hypothetical protein